MVWYINKSIFNQFYWNYYYFIGTICIICEYAVSFIENELKNNVTEAAIISTLDKVNS